MDKTLIEIRKLEAKENNDELGGFLIQLAKHGEQPLKYENEFRKHFNSSDWYLRKAAVFCLLFALQIDKPEYRNKALEFVNDKGEDEEVRRWAAAGLAQTYRNTKSVFGNWVEAKRKRVSKLRGEFLGFPGPYG